MDTFFFSIINVICSTSQKLINCNEEEENNLGLLCTNKISGQLFQTPLTILYTSVSVRMEFLISEMFQIVHTCT